MGNKAILDHIFGCGDVTDLRHRQANQRPVVHRVEGGDSVLLPAGQRPDRGYRHTGGRQVRTSR